MSETRIRGGEVVLRLARENAPLVTMTAFKEFAINFRGRILEEGYLGETAPRFDDMSDGIGGNFTIHAESQDLLLLLQYIQERQQRVRSVQTSRINGTARFSFPNGDTPKAFVKDMKFGEIPLSIPERTQYVNASFPFNAERARFIVG
ncbi:MAG: hypothetical protein EPN91_05445 [Salinibacterium sp.]|nr:MAG: hypothetical protein EPN91_05445 [Salinibacterium sp.]